MDEVSDVEAAATLVVLYTLAVLSLLALSWVLNGCFPLPLGGCG